MNRTSDNQGKIRQAILARYYKPASLLITLPLLLFCAQALNFSSPGVVLVALQSMIDIAGNHALALLGVAVAIRLLLFLPALKSDRDARLRKSLSTRVTRLQSELSGHPRALSDATSQLYRQFRLRPALNLFSSVFQLSLMVLFCAAVSQVSVDWEPAFLWFDSATSKDTLLIMPALASALFLGVLVLQSSARTLQTRLVYALAVTGLFFLLQASPVAVNLYLAISMGLLILQGMVFAVIANTRQWDFAGSDRTRSIKDTGLIPLDQAHCLPESTGKKATRLGQLIEAGYNVPDGFVITREITDKARRTPDQPLLTRSQAKKLGTLWKHLAAHEVAVRSSGAMEDGADCNFAGVYESILNVKRDQLEDAVREVYQSLCSERSVAYTLGTGEDAMPTILDQGGVIVQKMVAADYTGVMHTEHSGTTGALMVEMVAGSGEELLSGKLTPDIFAFGKLSNQLLEEVSSSTGLPPIDLEPLLALGRELEALFEHPQDIEWAYADGRYFLLQSCNTNHSSSSGDTLKNLGERERGKLLQNLLGERKRVRRSDKMVPDELVFVQNELSRQLPRPTPFSADFMQRLWAAGGSTDRACQALGMPYNVHFRSAPYLNTLFGWTYANKQEERRRLGKGPGALTAFRLVRDAESAEAQFRDEFLPVFQDEMVERNAVSMNSLNLNAATRLLSSWVRRFIQDTDCTAQRICISADFHVKSAVDKLSAANIEPARYLESSEPSVVSHAMSLLEGSVVSADNIEEFLLLFGHRAPQGLDFEFSQPRFNEDMNLVQQYIKHSAQAAHTQEKDQLLLPDNKALANAVQRARKFMRLKEEARHYCLIELAQIRRLLLAIDEKCQLDGLIFQLHIDEVMQLIDASQREPLLAIARQRSEEAQAWKSLQLPASLSVSDLERIDMLSGTRLDFDSLNGSVETTREPVMSDSASTTTAMNDQPQPASVAEQASIFMSDESTSINTYQLTPHKMRRYQQNIERRAMKDKLGDRRAVPRFTASGEIESDRRAANRAANIKMMKKTG